MLGYVKLNMKSMLKNHLGIFLLIMLSEIAAAICILFSYGLIMKMQDESKKLDYEMYYYDYDLSDSNRVEKYFLYYLDANDQRCAAKNGAWGMSNLYYPVTRVHKVSFLDENGNPVTTTEGYAILEYEEDENGNRTWEGYYDSLGAQVNCAAGYSSVERGYDGEGRLISERYLDRYNKLTNNVNGVAGWNGYYDSEGTLVITNQYDQDRKAVPANNQ